MKGVKYLVADNKESLEKKVDTEETNEEMTEKENQEENKQSEKETLEQTLKKELDECKEKLLRTTAEYENFRKRSEKEKEAIYSDALSLAVLGILPIADSLDAALSSSESQSEEYKKGIGLLRNQFFKALSNLKVEAFGEVGEQFDPSIHNAISHIEEDTEEQNVISKVFQRGYKSPTRVIRHAMVQVSN